MVARYLSRENLRDVPRVVTRKEFEILQEFLLQRRVPLLEETGNYTMQPMVACSNCRDREECPERIKFITRLRAISATFNGKVDLLIFSLSLFLWQLPFFFSYRPQRSVKQLIAVVNSAALIREREEKMMLETMILPLRERKREVKVKFTRLPVP